ncbi:hypothetical protein LSAT2_011362 [Lamellibrachia satsuma]|nr:hypothetical protein LSAT2_011362 [Lamellibrachia satsuma]
MFTHDGLFREEKTSSAPMFTVATIDGRRNTERWSSIWSQTRLPGVNIVQCLGCQKTVSRRDRITMHSLTLLSLLALTICLSLPVNGKKGSAKSMRDLLVALGIQPGGVGGLLSS